MKRLFGTDGMRGEAGIFPLDDSTIATAGSSLALRLKRKLGRQPLIIIGRDTRESGEWIEQALIAGINNTGAKSKSAGVITTPGIAYLTRSLPADAGIVISASHNPYRDNGLKIFAPSGRKLDEQTERLIEADIYSEREKAGHATRPITAATTGAAQAAELRGRYLDFLANEIGGGLSLRNLRLVLDCANGAASQLAPELFERLNAQVTPINNNPNGQNINLNCGSLHTETLKQAVLKQSADLGIAFDGDADRALFVDRNGQLVNGDGTLWVLANYLQSRNELTDATVVATVMSNIGLELALKDAGIRLVRTDVGDKYVLEELQRLGATLGGEQSGHIIFPDLSLAGDGMITALSLLRVMTAEGKALDELAQGLRTFPQILVNVVVKTKRPFAELDTVQEVAREVERELGSEGRLLLRYSGTEPLARIMIEGKTQEEINSQAARLADVIQRTLGVNTAR
ncbi:MAG TPA: phosphoglucosamine mutase [Pyrinomonadaceae bacterium]|nr:phosphoglucosamine mutase [Pyrinomonadaceae bacterium]